MRQLCSYCVRKSVAHIKKEKLKILAKRSRTSETREKTENPANVWRLRHQRASNSRALWDTGRWQTRGSPLGGTGWRLSLDQSSGVVLKTNPIKNTCSSEILPLTGAVNTTLENYSTAGGTVNELTRSTRSQNTVHRTHPTSGPTMTGLEPLVSDRGLVSLWGHYWQRGDRSHDNKQMHTWISRTKSSSALLCNAASLCFNLRFVVTTHNKSLRLRTETSSCYCLISSPVSIWGRPIFWICTRRRQRFDLWSVSERVPDEFGYNTVLAVQNSRETLEKERTCLCVDASPAGSGTESTCSEN